VVLRDAQALEVVLVRLHLGALDDGEAEAGEDVEDAAAGLRDGVEAAPAHGAAGEGDVERLRDE
jgi:hypothetical protein